MAGWPFEAVIGALFVIVMARSHLIYWLGRGAFSGASALATQVAHGHEPRSPGAGADGTEVEADGAHEVEADARLSRLHRFVTSPTARRGLRLVHRWGPFAVTFAYLTVGVQTAIFAGSGLLRMPYLRFTLASVPGSVAWAFIWGTVGLGAVWAAVTLAARSPWALAGIVAAVLALVGWLVVRCQGRRAAEGARGGGTGDVDAAARADEVAAS